MLRAVCDTLLSVVYPQACRVCQNIVENSSLGVACYNCWKLTRIFSGSEILCKKCGAYLAESGIAQEAVCHRCDDHFYDSAAAVGIYENALASSILHLKRSPFVGRNLRILFISAFQKSNFYNADLIVPVPLSDKRFLERGFNQAEVLANILARETEIGSDDKSLMRKTHTPMHRVAMDRKAREMTVQNAFDVKRPRLVAGRNIVLVDDLFTTGATVSYCAKALKKSGAAKVNVLTLARAV